MEFENIYIENIYIENKYIENKYIENKYIENIYIENIYIERVEIKDIYTNDYNTNNHPKDPNDEEAQSKNYEVEINRFTLSEFKDLIEYPMIAEYEFTKQEADVLIEAAKIGIVTRKRTELLTEELLEIETRLHQNIKEIQSSSNGFFFRFDGSSPKDGKFHFPIYNAKEMIDQIVTSLRARKCLLRDQRKMFICHFDYSWDTNRELRVFVRKSKVTAISQYCSYRKENPFHLLNDDELKSIAKMIISKVSSLHDEISKRSGSNDYVCDVLVKSTRKIKIIEYNPFGYWLSSGSCLFHWIQDKEKLYNEDGIVYFRIGKE